MLAAALLAAAAAAIMLTIAVVADVVALAWAALVTSLVAGVLLAVGVARNRPRRSPGPTTSTWSGGTMTAAGSVFPTGQPTIRVIKGPLVGRDDDGRLLEPAGGNEHGEAVGEPAEGSASEPHTSRTTDEPSDGDRSDEQRAG